MQGVGQEVITGGIVEVLWGYSGGTVGVLLRYCWVIVGVLWGHWGIVGWDIVEPL